VSKAHLFRRAAVLLAAAGFAEDFRAAGFLAAFDSVFRLAAVFLARERGAAFCFGFDLPAPEFMSLPVRAPATPPTTAPAAAPRGPNSEPSAAPVAAPTAAPGRHVRPPPTRLRRTSYPSSLLSPFATSLVEWAQDRCPVGRPKGVASAQMTCRKTFCAKPGRTAKKPAGPGEDSAEGYLDPGRESTEKRINKGEARMIYRRFFRKTRLPFLRRARYVLHFANRSRRRS
jgi:hypothetical protein